MIVADIEIRSNECEKNENIIDLSLDDEIPGNSRDIEKRTCDDEFKQVRVKIIHSFRWTVINDKMGLRSAKLFDTTAFRSD